MATEQALQGDVTAVAGASFASSQYLACELGTNGQVTVCNNAGDRVWGIIQDKAPSGAASRIRRRGVTKWKSDGSGTPIAIGDEVGTDASGKCIKKTGDNTLFAGFAQGASSADGTIIPVDLVPGGLLGA